MRIEPLFVALVAGVCAACARTPMPTPERIREPTAAKAPDSSPLEEAAWLTEKPQNAQPYANETLDRFRKLVDGHGWRSPAWNAQGTLEATHDKTGLTLVLIPAGKFIMGSPDTEEDRDDDETQHHVTVPAFLLSKTECTREAWDRIGGDSIATYVGAQTPIVGVSWKNVSKWCGKSGLRLPSESEWEYTCRAGTTTAFWSGLGCYPDVCWFYFNSISRPHVVGEKKPNPWGLHDTHGNVWEWCQDVKASFDDTPINGTAHNPRGSGKRVKRGGGWANADRYCRSAERIGWSPDKLDIDLGFRPATDLPR